MRIGVWGVCLYGFSVIALFLYSTHLLPSILPNPKSLLISTQPNITIFTAPEPFIGPVGIRQSMAIRSWLGLSLQVNVVLFSQNPSAVSFASTVSPRVYVDPTIDFTFLGTPYFHSMIEKSRVYPGDIVVFIDPEIVLLPDFISTLGFVHKLDSNWFLIASPRNVSHFPFWLDEAGKNWLKEGQMSVTSKELQEVLAQYPLWNYCNERMLLAWNNKDFPLHNAVLPPFLYRKGFHNRWIIHEASISKFRFLFDASWTIPSFSLWDLDDPYINHSFRSSIPMKANRSWEHVGNLHIAASYGSMPLQEFDYSSLMNLIWCDHKYIFVHMNDDKFYPTINQGNEGLFFNWTNKTKLACVDDCKSHNSMLYCSSRNQLESLSALDFPFSLYCSSRNQMESLNVLLDFPFSLESLLSMTSDQNKSIILTVAGHSYKDILMSWVCRLRRLFVTNFVICALDQETYEFAILQGLPVFYDPSTPSDISFDYCFFGTKCFRRVTKVKSRMVLKILKLGYNVLLSDADVYWFSNPLSFLYSFGPAVLVGQSDEDKVKGPLNLPKNFNSGFYFARSDGSTIAAMEKVVNHATNSDMSEQPSFYDSLCGEGGSNRISNDRCFDPETNLTVHFLDRKLFPNGAYLDLWKKKDVKSACKKIGCLVLHNNWIVRSSMKLVRQVLSGLWEYDRSRRMCLQI